MFRCTQEQSRRGCSSSCTKIRSVVTATESNLRVARSAIAKKITRTVSAVTSKRVHLKIPAFSGWPGRGPAWTDEQLALLGTHYDEVIAKKIGRTQSAVCQKRIALKIPVSRDRRVHPDVNSRSYSPLSERITGGFAMRAAKLNEKKSTPEAGDELVTYFNNCHNRDHLALYGSGAFFDLRTSGRQGTQARNLCPGHVCVVGTVTPEGRVAFNWHSFTHEALLPDEEGVAGRVFFGRFLTSETLPKAKAARSACYSALFTVNGDFKNGSVFHKSVHIAKRKREARKLNPAGSAITRGEAGYGDSVENKLVEAAAIRAVRKSYQECGLVVHSVERAKCGFDLECEKNQEVENVEVKGVRGPERCFIITAGEVKQARTNSKFVLIVVTLALSASPILTRYLGSEFCEQFDLTPVQYRAVLRG